MENRIRNEEDLRKLREQILALKNKTKLRIVLSKKATCCIAKGSNEVSTELKKEVEEKNLKDKVEILETGCLSFCQIEPIIIVKGILYANVKKENVKDIIEKTVLKDEIVEELVYTHPITKEKIAKMEDIPFYKKQKRILLDNTIKIQPERIEDYIAIGGYTALLKALKMSSEEIINEVKKSGLRGRGGAGFPTGIKWESTRNANGFPKYIICNADEGDPGAYANRSLLEGNPHCVIEGIIIGAYAIGCNEGYIYVRYEYPLAVKMLEKAIDDCREYGLLGKNILNSKFDFDIYINRGGGAFVCGESTALMASLEGKIGEPRPKYVHTSEKGLWDKPSCLNNVETFANIPLIINNGSEWFAKIGTEKSKGTKIFSLVGKINNNGLVEVPMGIRLMEIIYDIGGGIPKGKKFKAIQTGGPSGGCIPESLIEIPVDYDELTKTGSIMGSGGMIVMDEDTCMVDFAKYFLNFLREESCGKCVPCREGIKQMHKILQDITDGKATEETIELLEELGEVVQIASLCQLGGTAPNPVLTTLKYFKEEYIAHIKDKSCPAKVCKALIEFSIDEKNCTGCMVCLRNCPSKAITGEKRKVHFINKEKCIKCGVCFEVCKFNAVVKK